MKDQNSVTNNYNKNKHSRSIEQFNLLSSSIDVFETSEFNLEQGIKTLLSSIKYYCQFDFVGYWKYNQYKETYTLCISSENFSKPSLAKHELRACELPWVIKDYSFKEFVISKTSDYSIDTSKNTIRVVREPDAHFFAVIPIVINSTQYGMITFSNYNSSNAIPKSIELELKGFSKLLSNAIYKKLLIEQQQKYYDLLKISCSWKLLFKKPMPIFLENTQQLNWMYKYGFVSTSSDEMANSFGYKDAKEFNKAAVSINEFTPSNREHSINFLMKIIKSNYSALNVKTSLIDINKNELFYKCNIRSNIISGEVVSINIESFLYNLDMAKSNSNPLQSSDLIIKENLDLLTKREFETLLYVIGGSPNKLIADELGISEKTVKVHRGNVMKKLKICCFAELVRACDHIGLKPRYIKYNSTSNAA